MLDENKNEDANFNGVILLRNMKPSRMSSDGKSATATINSATLHARQVKKNIST